MKTIRGALAAALLLTSALSVQAADYAHFRGPTWRLDLVNFLNGGNPPNPQKKCDPASVTGGFTSQGDVHVYCLTGSGFAGTYTLLLYPRHSPDQANNTIKALVDGQVARIFGFIGDDVYVLTWTKQ
jgi:hypothetical protein